MKTLDFNEMEVVQGGISCAGVGVVLDYLWTNNRNQYFALVETSFIGCNGAGGYQNFWG